MKELITQCKLLENRRVLESQWQAPEDKKL